MLAALDGFQVVIQPIVHLRDFNHLAGLECLVRGPAGPLEHPDQFLGEARRCRAFMAVEAAICRTVAARVAPRLPLNGANGDAPSAFVNVSRETLLAGPDGAAGRSLLPFADRVTLELTGDGPATIPCTALQEAWSRWRWSGFRLSIDDLGEGHNGLAAVVGLEPDYVKLDLGQLRRVAPFRLPGVLRSLADCVKELGAVPIAEKVESSEELELVEAAGVGLVQGFHIALPQDFDTFFAGRALP